MAAPGGEKRPYIKKVIKHGGGHGGSWKVAYADFVTAMMAFFLLMWLLGMASKEQKEGLSQYFQKFNLFDKGGQTFTISPTSSQSINLQVESRPMSQELTTDDLKEFLAQEAKALQERLKKAVEEKLEALKDQIMVEVTEGGVRVQMVDKESNSMFALGSSDINDKARSIIKLVTENIKDTKYRIAIEGHTDAAPFRSGQTTNWELSTARATATRRELELEGINPERIARVVGYADKELLIKENPKDPRNRRISLILMPPPREEQTPGDGKPAPASEGAPETGPINKIPFLPKPGVGVGRPLVVPPVQGGVDLLQSKDLPHNAAPTGKAVTKRNHGE